MSDALFKLFGAALLCVMIGLVLKKESPDTALVLRMISGITLAAVIVSAMSPVIDYIGELGERFETAGTFSVSVGVLLKALGVSILTHICAGVCRDSGEGGIAYYVELGGKTEILLISLPLLEGLLDTALGLLEI